MQGVSVQWPNGTKFDTGEVSRIYHEQYQRDSVSESALSAYDSIAEVLVRHFRPRTAIDVGSGGGALVRGLLARGVDAVGIEGSAHAVSLFPDRVRLHDLRSPWRGTSSYDLVTCFDVAEHVEPEYADTLVQTILALSTPSAGVPTYIVFGAARDGQDGLGHVNCQHPCYWIHKLCSPYVELHACLSEQIRREIREMEGTNFLWWVAQNLMVFGHRKDAYK